MRVDVERVRELCAKGLNVNQIGARLGLAPRTVRAACKRNGITVAAAPHSRTDISFATPVP
jgi:hypothetical protein